MTLQDYIENAIAAYLTESGGGMVTGWVFVADFVEADGEERWAWETSPGQRMMSTLALADWLKAIADFEVRRYLETNAEG